MERERECGREWERERERGRESRRKSWSGRERAGLRERKREGKEGEREYVGERE